MKKNQTAETIRAVNKVLEHIAEQPGVKVIPNPELDAHRPAPTPADAPTIPPKEPDYYARLIAARPQDAAGILATLCRRKDYAIRQTLKAHQEGFSFDDAARALADVFKPRHAAA